MATSETESIELTDVGPIAHLNIEVPEGGGVVEILGANGCGKSTALEAVDALAGAKPEFSRRDGCDESLVTGFGATLKLTRAASRRGRLDCIAIEGSQEAATLVDPQIKDPEKADFRRTQALLRLIAAEVKEDAFNELAGAEFIDWESVDRSDSVAMAASIKRQLQKAAREEEGLAERKAGEFDFSRRAAEGLDMEAESDAEKLQEGLEDAIAFNSHIATKVMNAIEDQARLQTAREKLRSVTKSYEGPSPDNATERYTESQDSYADVQGLVTDLRKKLQWAESTAETARSAMQAALLVRTAAEEYERIVAEVTDVIEGDRLDSPSEDDIEASAGDVTEARQSVEQGALVRDAHLKLADGQAAREAGEAHTETAEQLRESADACDEVLSNAVNSNVLRVKDGRLVTQTERGTTFFSELSQGERWHITLDIIVARTRGTDQERRALITVPQEAWEGLDDENQAHVHQLARERNVLILAPRATSGPIRAEAFAAN